MENNQTNQINFKIAGFFRRLAAYIIDMLPILIVIFLINYFFFGFDELLKSRFSNPNDFEIRKEFLAGRNIVRDLTLVLWIIYSLIADASKLQGTFGKKIMKIKVVNENGDRISIGKSFIRNFFKIISAIPLYLGFIWSLFNKKRRGWHDMVAKTYVIER